MMAKPMLSLLLAVAAEFGTVFTFPDRNGLGYVPAGGGFDFHCRWR